MIKIFNVQQIKAWDTYTIANERITSIDLMERACLAFVSWFNKYCSDMNSVHVICGEGNNGGDGLGIARLLQQQGVEVTVWIIKGKSTPSKDFAINKKRLSKKVKCNNILEVSDIEINHTITTALIDAIFGLGLSRPLTGIYEKIVQHINCLNVRRIAIDMPTGMMADGSSSGIVFKAHHTISFESPKQAFFTKNNAPYVGQWTTVSINLSKKYMRDTSTNHYLLNKTSIKDFITPRTAFSHKGNYGHALLVAGSYGKMGACILAARAALRSGIGLLTTHIPKSGYQIIQTTVPEAMASIDQHNAYYTKCPSLDKYTTIAVGPGIGQHADTVKALKDTLLNAHKPMVLDADALNALASDKALQSLVPQHSILTPHLGELKRLVGAWKDDYEKWDKASRLSHKMKSIIIVKGAYTTICTPEKLLYYNPTGNPGMATAGSGDVLIGVITGLLSQGLSALHSALSAVYIHGLAGDIAQKKKGENSLIASDIIETLPDAFKVISASKHEYL